MADVLSSGVYDSAGDPFRWGILSPFYVDAMNTPMVMKEAGVN